MKNFVGVADIIPLPEPTRFVYSYPAFLKRQALFFDQIAIPDLRSKIDLYYEMKITEFRQFVSEIEWLHDHNILFEPPFELKHLTLPQLLKVEASRQLWHKYAQEGESIKDNDDTQIRSNVLAQFYGYWRFQSVLLRECYDMDAFPIIDEYEYKMPSVTFVPSRKVEIIKIILNCLPIPDELVSWEQILDYRNDPDTKEKVLSLRRWVNRLSTGELLIAEIQDEIEWLLQEYNKHMKLHKMKANLMALETFVKAPLEVIENLVKIKWSKLPGLLFTIKKRKIAILEAEINAPGRELSYIVKTREKFKKHLLK